MRVPKAMQFDVGKLSSFHQQTEGLAHSVRVERLAEGCVEVPMPPSPPPALAFTDGGWTVSVVADEASEYMSPQVLFGADGLPAIFHQAPTGVVGPEGENETGLTMTQCADSRCSQATSGDAIALDMWAGGTFVLDGEGLPIAAYWSYETGQMLGFARCDDAVCSGVTSAELFEADAWANPDIAVASNGLAVMAFQNYTFNPGPIQVAFCVDAACSSVDVVDLDSDCLDADCNRFWVYNTTSLALTPDDRPVVVYTPGSGKLRLVVCDDPRCSSFTASTVDDTGSNGEAARVTIGLDGNPVIGYYADGTAKLAFCLDPLCEQVTVAELGESIRDAWYGPRMAVLGDGRIAVAYSAPTDSPRLAVCSYPCADPVVSVLADVTGSYSIVAGPDGLPLIAFIDGAESINGPPYEIPGQLVDAKCTDPSCLLG